MRRLRNAGQHLSELALLLVLASAVVFTLRFYLVRGFQAKYKVGADYLFSEIEKEATKQGKSLGDETQYDPYYSEAETTETRTANSTIGFPDTTKEETVVTSGWKRIGLPR